jgi:hypothetical protein
LDNAKGFNLRELDKDSKKYYTFTMPDGLKVQGTVLPFGYVNTFFEYQKGMEVVTAGLVITYVYIDDCLGRSETKFDHYKALCNPVNTYEKYKVRLRLQKCFVKSP